jgi:predicted DNA-binding transcriptional regulator AlpA
VGIVDLQTDLLSQGQAAALLGKSEAWLERSRWAGTGPLYTRIGRSVRYLKSDLIAYLESNRRSGTRTPQQAA